MFSSQSNLAVAYYDDGHLEQAIDILKNVVSIGKEKNLQRNPNFLASLTNLGVAYYHYGWIKKAIEVLRQALEARQRVLPPTDPRLLRSHLQLAIAYQKARNFEEAVNLVKKIHQKSEPYTKSEEPLFEAALVNLVQDAASPIQSQAQSPEGIHEEELAMLLLRALESETQGTQGTQYSFWRNLVMDQGLSRPEVMGEFQT